MASSSLVIKALLDATANGKDVFVVVELQARFDEEANIRWSKLLTDAGVRVIWDHESQSAFETMSDYQKEGDRRVRYAHIGTGNFNEKTARTYTDFSLLTAHPEITSEVRQVFSFIKAPHRSYSFRHLWLSPTTQREQIYHRIDREIDNAKSVNVHN